MSMNATKTSFQSTEIFFWSIILFAILFRIHQTKPKYHPNDRVRITTTVRSEPIRHSNTQYLKLAGLKAYLPSFPEINYGDFVIVEGEVGEDEKLLHPALIKHKTSSNILYQTRNQIIKNYQGILPEPHSSLVAGVVIGSKASLPTDFWESLKLTGTAHVVVASGMNVTLVGSFLINLLVNFVKRKKAIILALFGIWIYTILSGFDAPLIRAAIMGSLTFSSQALGRVYSAWRALFLSAGFMLIISPSWLTDLGFILSFVATGSLMLFNTKIDRLIYIIPNPLREGLATSLAAQIGVAPILYLTFGQLSLISPLINSLILWTIPPITIVGGLAALASLIHPILAIPFLYLIYPLTYWFVFVVRSFI